MEIQFTTLWTENWIFRELLFYINTDCNLELSRTICELTSSIVLSK